MTQRADTPLRVAFLGGGIHSAVGRVHRIAVEMDRRFELVAGCFSRFPERNRASAKEYGVPAARTYADLDRMIRQEKGRIDAFIILTPTPDHKKDVIRCVNAGIPVICEKAMAASVREAVEIGKALKKKRGFLAVTFNYSGYPILRELKDLIAAGKLGRLTQVQIEMPQEGFIRVGKDGRPVKPQAWRLRDRELPTLSLDLGVHLHHMVHFLTGEKPRTLTAVQARFGAFEGIVDNVSGLARYSNGLECSFWYSKTALGNRNGLKVRVYGKKGSAEWLQMNPEELLISDRLGVVTKLDRASKDAVVSSQTRYNRFKAGHPAGYIEAFANLYGDIADSLSQYLRSRTMRKVPYVFGAKEAAEGLAFLEAVKASSARKKWMTPRAFNEI